VPQKAVGLPLLLIKHLDKDVCICFTYIIHFYCLTSKKLCWILHLVTCGSQMPIK